MYIEDVSSQRQFRDLKVGDFFLSCGNKFIRSEEVMDNDGVEWRAVNLDTGQVWGFLDESEVSLLKKEEGEDNV